jgi:hypothetical protein
VRDPEQVRALQHWQMVEMFYPQLAPKVDDSEHVCTLGTDVPWRLPAYAPDESGKSKTVFAHDVFIGVFDQERVFSEITRFFPPDPDSEDQYPAGEAAMAYVCVDERGQYVPDTFALSTCAWGMGEFLKEGTVFPLKKAGFDSLVAELADEVEHCLGEGRDCPEAPLAQPDLERARSLVAERLNVESCLRPDACRVRTKRISRRNPEHGGEFLNSFFLEDLARVEDSLRRGRARGALGAYLGPGRGAAPTDRVDVRDALGAVFDNLAPERIPLGHWPAAPEQPLVLGQQSAVNYAKSVLGTGEGVVGVNGPPGTGKTTLLRDLIADVVVERAIRLSQLARPGDAFTKTITFKRNDRTFRVHQLRDDLTGHEIVVASTNNGAVENVVLEIPLDKALGPEWIERAAEVDYFSALATALVTGPGSGPGAGPGRGPGAGSGTGPGKASTPGKPSAPESDADPGPGRKAWALLAARLGNKKNCADFTQSFYWPKAENGGVSGMAELLDAGARTPSWEESVLRFTRALDAARQGQQDRQAVFAAMSARRSILAAISRTDADLARAAAEVEQADQAVRALGSKIAALQEDRQSALDRRTEHSRFRPGLWSTLMTLGRAHAEWRRADRAYAATVSELESELDTARRSQRDWADHRDQGEPAQAVQRLRGQASRLNERLAAGQTLVANWRSHLGPQLPGEAWFDPSARISRELGSLWTDPSWNEDRSRLALEALRLHKAFIMHNHANIKRNLAAVLDVMNGAKISDDAALAAWQSFFCVVPVVSTTLASFARLFGSVGPGQIGWLLLDEAGQVGPQQAVGAIWRSRRAVVVGDPNQLKPVTSFSFKAEQALRRGFDIPERWLTTRASAQELADHATGWGTELADQVTGGTKWVGLPLVVHRRCDEPMFSISNMIAYDGLMVSGTPQAMGEGFAKRYLRLPRSKWLDVPASGVPGAGHWLPDEGKELDRVLDYLLSIDFDMREVLVVSPFRTVATRLRHKAKTYPGITAGTIHTAQGKEGDIVIIVLGGNPERPGAKRWAAAEPNLLNVAVSRAKRRLYVIGDRDKWEKHQFFSVLASQLEAWERASSD